MKLLKSFFKKDLYFIRCVIDSYGSVVYVNPSYIRYVRQYTYEDGKVVYVAYFDDYNGDIVSGDISMYDFDFLSRSYKH